MNLFRSSFLLSILWGTLFIIYLLITPPLLSVGTAVFVCSLFLIRPWGFAGFLAVGVSGFLICLGFVDRFHVPHGHRLARTKSLFATLRTASDIYRGEYGSSPQGEISSVFEQLSGENPKKVIFFEVSPHSLGKHGEILDGWGTPIRLEHRVDTVVFLSAGQDRRWGTADDIKSQ